MVLPLVLIVSIVVFVITLTGCVLCVYATRGRNIVIGSAADRLLGQQQQQQPQQHQSMVAQLPPLTLKTYDAVNGILNIELLNLSTDQIEENRIEFEFVCVIKGTRYAFSFNQDKCNIPALALTPIPCIFIRFTVHLQDYSIRFKMRYKTNEEEWSPFSDEYSAQIQSLITSTFAVNQIVNYRQKSVTDFYLKQGLIVQILDDDFVGILPQQYWRRIRNDDDDDDDPTRHILKVHKSRILGRKIDLDSLIDTRQHIAIDSEWTDFLILKSMHIDDTRSLFTLLTDIYANYAQHSCDAHHHGQFADYDTYFIGRYIACHVLQYISYDSKVPRFMMHCLLHSSDGILEMFKVRHYIIESRIAALHTHTIDDANQTDLCHVDDLSDRCDVCNVGISSFDWMLKCPASICDYHVVCLQCANNVVVQYVQLLRILDHILSDRVDYDCIQLIGAYTVAPIVHLA